MGKYFKYADYQYYNDLRTSGPATAEHNIRKRYTTGGALGGTVAGLLARSSNTKAKLLNMGIGIFGGAILGDFIGKRKARGSYNLMQKYDIPVDKIKDNTELRDQIIYKKIDKYYTT